MTEYFEVGRRFETKKDLATYVTGYVHELQDDVLTVTFDGDASHYPYRYELAYARVFFQPLCKHCNLAHEDHANDGKCIYGPGSWE